MVMRGGLVVSAGCALHGARIVCDAMRAVWLHSRGSGGAMRLAMGGFKVDGERDGLRWLSRFKLIRLRRISLATLRRDGWMG